MRRHLNLKVSRTNTILPYDVQDLYCCRRHRTSSIVCACRGCWKLPRLTLVSILSLLFTPAIAYHNIYYLKLRPSIRSVSQAVSIASSAVASQASVYSQTASLNNTTSGTGTNTSSGATTSGASSATTTTSGAQSSGTSNTGSTGTSSQASGTNVS